ncbi:MAG: primosomal protein N' [Anaerolineae bacterium]|nr:primosomal protein N' [Anaerolineae bacterium]
MFAEVAINIPVDKTFDYEIPPELVGTLRAGYMVHVPFRTATEPGIVVAMHETSDVPQTKQILDLLHPEPVVTPERIKLAYAIRDACLAPIGICIWLMLPAGIAAQHDIRVALIEPVSVDTDLQREIVKLLKRRGALRGRQLDLALPGKHWRAAVEELVAAGVVHRETILTPPRVRPKVVRTATLVIEPEAIEYELQALARPSRVADLLESVMTASTPLDADLTRKETGASPEQLARLVELGWLKLSPDNTLTIDRPEPEVLAYLADLRHISKPGRILRQLAHENESVAVNWIYAQSDAKLHDLKRLEEYGLIAFGDQEVWRDTVAAREFVPTSAPPLSAEQAASWSPLERAINGEGGLFLLHGVTGSGKTELYLRAIQATLKRGRSAIFLVPEIALTAQTVHRVAARFPGQVAVVHSRLSEGERYDTWRRARMGLIRIVVGARSALFTPMPDIGLIILDEEHDQSYKQSGDQSPPHYHARDVAEMIIRENHGVLILGSATPAIETQYRSEQGDIQRLELPNRIMGHRERIHEQEGRTGVIARYRPTPSADALMIDLPPVQVVDMRAELKAGNTSIFSTALQEALRGVLARREQALLLLNRRGQSTYVFCRDCGFVAKCPNCDTPLTHHREGSTLRCHRCGHSQPEPTVCPECGSRRIKYFGAGTQQVEHAIKALFPQARVVRWDADSASTPGAHEAILQHFIDRYADIVVGTQIIAKGLDLPLVTLVGIVSADVSLNLPDFRAAERSFQLLTQAAGRAGRGLLGGKVILQTYQPEHYAIRAAANHDTQAFYSREIAYRREMGYPPFRRLLRILFSFPQETRARAEAERAAATLRQRIKQLNMSGTELIGPAPCFFTRIDHDYRWHLLLRGPDPANALRGITIPSEWHVDVDPLDIL